MDNIKISVSFKLHGSIMYQERNDNNLLNSDTKTVKSRNKKTKHNTDIIKPAKYKPCFQSINMTNEVYHYMMDTPVDSMPVNHWKKLSENQRIEEHLKEIQHDLDAISFEFKVFND